MSCGSLGPCGPGPYGPGPYGPGPYGPPWALMAPPGIHRIILNSINSIDFQWNCINIKSVRVFVQFTNLHYARPWLCVAGGAGVAHNASQNPYIAPAKTAHKT